MQVPPLNSRGQDCLSPPPGSEVDDSTTRVRVLGPGRGLSDSSGKMLPHLPPSPNSILRFIHTLACIAASFLLWLNYIPLYGKTTFFIPSAADPWVASTSWLSGAELHWRLCTGGPGSAFLLRFAGVMGGALPSPPPDPRIWKDGTRPPLSDALHR